MRELAEVAGVSHTVIARAEHGRAVSMPTLDALAGVLGDEVREVVTVGVRKTAAGEDNPVVAARRAQGLSRRQAAKRIGVADKTLARVESGQRVHPSTAKRIALAYGLDVAVVIDLTEPNGAAA